MMVLGVLILAGAVFLLGCLCGAVIAAKIVGDSLGAILHESVSKGEIDPNSARVLLDRLEKR